MGEKTTRLVLGLPWYNGPDEECFDQNFEFLKYLGRLQERSMWHELIGHDMFNGYSSSIDGLLEENISDHGLENPTGKDWRRLGKLEIGISNYSRLSLVGKARDNIIESAQTWDADYLLFWDADMRFNYSAFLRLWRHEKPIVAALAFTSREPVEPVVYRIKTGIDHENENAPMFISEPVFDYPRDQLITNKDIDGHIDFGFGMVLIDMRVFRQIPQPWFNTTGCGEDWFFCTRAHQYDVQRYVDTSVKCAHKKHKSDFVTEDYFDHSKNVLGLEYKKAYDHLFDDDGKIVPLGEVMS